MAFYMPYLQLRSGHPCFFTAANPGIKTGGMGLESKFETLEKIPDYLKPKSILIKNGTKNEVVIKRLSESGITFPLIAKPDLGYRGLLVKKIKSESELKTYLSAYPIDFILQEFVSELNEFGVLYYRFPSEQRGHISSLTLKEFLHVTGDGQSTVEALINKVPRAKLQKERLKENRPTLLLQIPEKGKQINLGVIGNHSKGTQFINGNKFINDQLIATFDNICSQIQGMNYGRFDIKCKNLEDLMAGKNIVIIELNGVCSEPTHIYDAQKHSYFKALKDILNHWTIIYKISKANRKKGIRCMPPAEMIHRIRGLRRYMNLLKNA